jgi:hypothetical protein
MLLHLRSVPANQGIFLVFVLFIVHHLMFVDIFTQ